MEDVDMDGMPYSFIKIGGQGKGGIIGQMTKGAPSMFLVYIDIENLDVSTERVRELGGSVLAENKQAGQWGRFAVVANPTGAVFALWESAPE
jgi:hypothetical protein